MFGTNAYILTASFTVLFRCQVPANRHKQLSMLSEVHQLSTAPPPTGWYYLEKGAGGALSLKVHGLGEIGKSLQEAGRKRITVTKIE